MTGKCSYPLSISDATHLLSRALGREGRLLYPVHVGDALLYATEQSFDPRCETCVVAIGAFDGVHEGHRGLFKATREDASRRAARSIVVTFDPDPIDLIAPKTPFSRLLSCPDRYRHIASCGIDGIVTFPFTEALRRTTCESFCLEVLPRALNFTSIHVGSDFHLGSNRGGSVDEMVRLGSRVGFEVDALDLLSSNGQLISATRIRRLLRSGNLEEAEHLLGRCHAIRGWLNQQGSETCADGTRVQTIAAEIEYCLPAAGVYGAYVVKENEAYAALVGIDNYSKASDNPPWDYHRLLVAFATPDSTSAAPHHCYEVEIVFLVRLSSFEQGLTQEAFVHAFRQYHRWLCTHLPAQVSLPICPNQTVISPEDAMGDAI